MERHLMPDIDPSEFKGGDIYSGIQSNKGLEEEPSEYLKLIRKKNMPKNDQNNSRSLKGPKSQQIGSASKWRNSSESKKPSYSVNPSVQAQKQKGIGKKDKEVPLDFAQNSDDEETRDHHGNGTTQNQNKPNDQNPSGLSEGEREALIEEYKSQTQDAVEAVNAYWETQIQLMELSHQNKIDEQIKEIQEHYEAQIDQMKQRLEERFHSSSPQNTEESLKSPLPGAIDLNGATQTKKELKEMLLREILPEMEREMREGMEMEYQKKLEKEREAIEETHLKQMEMYMESIKKETRELLLAKGITKGVQQAQEPGKNFEMEREIKKIEREMAAKTKKKVEEAKKKMEEEMEKEITRRVENERKEIEREKVEMARKRAMETSSMRKREENSKKKEESLEEKIKAYERKIMRLEKENIDIQRRRRGNSKKGSHEEPKEEKGKEKNGQMELEGKRKDLVENIKEAWDERKEKRDKPFEEEYFNKGKSDWENEKSVEMDGRNQEKPFYEEEEERGNELLMPPHWMSGLEMERNAQVQMEKEETNNERPNLPGFASVFCGKTQPVLEKRKEKLSEKKRRQLIGKGDSKKIAEEMLERYQNQLSSLNQAYNGDVEGFGDEGNSKERVGENRKEGIEVPIDKELFGEEETQEREDRISSEPTKEHQKQPKPILSNYEEILRRQSSLIPPKQLQPAQNLPKEKQRDPFVAQKEAKMGHELPRNFDSFQSKETQETKRNEQTKKGSKRERYAKLIEKYFEPAVSSYSSGSTAEKEKGFEDSGAKPEKDNGTKREKDRLGSQLSPMLSTPQDIYSVIFGNEKLLKSLSPGSSEDSKHIFMKRKREAVLKSLDQNEFKMAEYVSKEVYLANNWVKDNLYLNYPPENRRALILSFQKSLKSIFELWKSMELGYLARIEVISKMLELASDEDASLFLELEKERWGSIFSEQQGIIRMMAQRNSLKAGIMKEAQKFHKEEEIGLFNEAVQKQMSALYNTSMDVIRLAESYDRRHPDLPINYKGTSPIDVSSLCASSSNQPT